MKNPGTPTDTASRPRYGAATAVLLVWTLITGLLWGLERWQRPSFTSIPGDMMLLSMACLGVLGMAVLQGFKNKAARPWLHVFIVFFCGAALLSGLHFGCKKMAVAALKSRLDEHVLIPTGWVKAGGETLAMKLHKLLEHHGVGSPQWLTDHVNNHQVVFRPTPDQLIERSRWPVRRAMAEWMTGDSKRAKYLMENWTDYFPAIIGPDVTLECRRDLMERLNAMRKKRGRSLNSSQTIDFCMALVVLTDPPEFEEWRVPVRDAMLNRGMIANHERELWMRTIDTLLALDPPESWVALTAPLTVHHSDFRIAVRQPVRGLVGNFDALVGVFDMYENHKHLRDAFVLWQGVGDSMEAWPEALDEDLAERIRNWRRDTLFRWLMTYTDDGKSMSRHHGLIEEIPDNRAVLEITHEQQLQLAEATANLAHEATDESDKEAMAGYLRHLYKAAPYLTKNQRTELGRSLIPVMLKPELFHHPVRDGSIHFDLTWTLWLWEIEPLMSEEQRESLQAGLAPMMGALRLNAPSTSVLLCIDAWSDRPMMSREFWLACAWHGWWRVVPADTPRERLELSASRLLPVPPVSGEEIGKLAHHLEEALAAGKFSAFRESLDPRHDGGTGNAQGDFVHISIVKLMHWQRQGTHGAATLSEFLKSEFYLRGLIGPEEIDFQDLIGKVQGTTPYSKIEIHRSPLAGNLFSDALKEPQTAVDAVIGSIGHENEDSPLHGLITAMETTPPDEEVVRAVWDALRLRSQHAKHKAEVFGALFRISHLMPRGERLAMRRDALNGAGIGRFLFTNSHSGWGYGYEPNPLLYPGGGIGIPWEDDELSAEHSWKTAISRQVKQFPCFKTESHRAEVFSYLANDVNPVDDLGKSREGSETVRPSAPLPPTPWQRARALHPGRPDLDFK